MSDWVSSVGDFAKGFGEGVWSGGTGMVTGLGNIAEGAYSLATDPNARAQAWNDAVQAAKSVEWAAQNPGQAATAIGQGASNLYNGFVNAEQQAEASGNGAEFWGNVVGQGAFAAGTVLVPGLAEAKLAGAAGEAGEVAEGLSAAEQGIGAVEGANAVADSSAGTSFLLRGDARPPETIFQQGFQPWGGDASLEDYVLNNSPSQYVGLTSDPDVAADFATNSGTRNGYIYATDPQPNGTVVNDVLPNNPFAAEQETAVPGGVPANQIRGATPIGPDYNFGDTSVLNPNYNATLNTSLPSVTPLAPGSSLLNTSSTTGAGLLGAGALGNSLSPAVSPSDGTSTPANSAPGGGGASSDPAASGADPMDGD